MQNSIKGLARRSKTAIILFKIFDNQRLKRRTTSGAIETSHGSTHLKATVNDSLAYIDKLFNDYRTYATLQPDDIVHRNILELGPGDNLGVALKFLAAGANSVVCLDRFYSKRDPHHEKEIYAALRESLGTEERKLFDEAISLDGEIALNPQRLRSIYGDTVEGLADKFGENDQPFDLIVSCAVLEEIYDPNPAFAAMDRLLNRGGWLVHKIDLGDYGMFRNQGMHPLTFLTISEPIYKRMASDSGLPNRKRLGYYVEKMKEFGYQSEFFVTSVIPTGRLEPAVEYIPGRFGCDSSRGLIDEIRDRLAYEFKSMDEEELLIDGVLLVARKPL
jgi:SAM-dependent methyltransferase